MGKEFEIGRPIAYYSYGGMDAVVIVRAVAYLHLLEFHLSLSSPRSECLGTPDSSRHNVSCVIAFLTSPTI